MSNPVDDQIQRAMVEARAGDKPRAKQILSEALKQNPKDARIWYLLSQVIDNREQKIQCLERALDLQPDNPQIKEKLDTLKKPELLPELNLNAAVHSVNISDPPKKKTAWWVYALLIIFIPILGCMCFGMIIGLGDTGGDVSNPFKTTHTIVYRVEGNSSSALISYTNDQTGTEQINSAHLPWKKTFEMKTGSPTSLVAQSNDTNKTITCIIELDGKEWKRSSSSGDYVVVTCTGWIGLE